MNTFLLSYVCSYLQYELSITHHPGYNYNMYNMCNWFNIPSIAISKMKHVESSATIQHTLHQLRMYRINKLDMAKPSIRPFMGRRFRGETRRITALQNAIGHIKINNFG